MSAAPEIAWGESRDGARFGLRAPAGELVAGSTIALELVCENTGTAPIWVFGFQPRYPRSLRVSPPKPDRPFIRVSFADVNVLHPPDAFVRLGPRERASTWLDLSFAFDRRGAGAWSIAFAYEPVRGAGGMKAWRPAEGSALTAIAELVVSRARSLRDAGHRRSRRGTARLDVALGRADDRRSAPIVGSGRSHLRGASVREGARPFGGDAGMEGPRRAGPPGRAGPGRDRGHP